MFTHPFLQFNELNGNAGPPETGIVRYKYATPVAGKWQASESGASKVEKHQGIQQRRTSKAADSAKAGQMM
ncbi:MAG: hypothetical protein ACOYYS_19660 [Chloroflexota bacterium]